MLHFLSTLDDSTKVAISNYISRMNAYDLSVRSVQAYGSYVNKNPSRHIKSTIASDVRRIDTFLTKKKYKHLSALAWNIGILNIDVENNLPHTHKDVIFLPYDFHQLPDEERISILIHEKIHVYQRLFPIYTHKLFCDVWSLVPFKIWSAININNKRSNPDLNNIIYAFFDPNRKRMCYHIQTYNPKPTSITDAQVSVHPISDADIQTTSNQKTTYHDLITKYNIKQYEHPNETMACFVTDVILNNIISEPSLVADDDVQQQQHDTASFRWIQTYM
jgi:hypothetical protein